MLKRYNTQQYICNAYTLMFYVQIRAVCSDKSRLLVSGCLTRHQITRYVIVVYLFITLPQPGTKSHKASYRINASFRFIEFLI